MQAHSVKVIAMKAVLSVFLCALSPTVLVFFTPPVTLYHHLACQHRSQCPAIQHCPPGLCRGVCLCLFVLYSVTDVKQSDNNALFL